MEDSRPVLIVDIDGTLLSQKLRRRKILQDMFDVEIDCDDLREGAAFDRLFQKLICSNTALGNCSLEDIKHRYYQMLFSNKYYEPWYFSVIEDANRVMLDLSKYVDIYYLSARNKSLYESTVWQLRKFNFPDIGGQSKLIILNHDVPPDEYRSFRRLSFEFKKKSVRFICGQRKALAGIGDIIEDICAFNANGVPGILYTNSLTEKDVEERFKESSIHYEPSMVAILGSWTEIGQYVKKLLKKV